MKNIILVIDWQNRYFENLNFPSKYMHGAVKNTARIIRKARENGDQIVWIGYGGERLKLWSDYEGGIVSELQELHRYSDPEFIKSTSDTFELKKFDEWISQQDFDRLVFTGYHVDDCVKKTLISAINKKGWGDKCILVEDACGARPEQKTRMAETFNSMSQYCGVIICSTRTLLNSYNQIFKGQQYWGRRKPYVKIHRGRPYTACVLIENIISADVEGRASLILAAYSKGKKFSEKDILKHSHHNEKTLRLWAKSHDIEPGLIEKAIENPMCEKIQKQISGIIFSNRSKNYRNPVNTIS